jgi:hypothetical protein
MVGPRQHAACEGHGPSIIIARTASGIYSGMLSSFLLFYT